MERQMTINIADRYAQVKMMIECLEIELKTIKTLAIATGQEKIEGNDFSLKIKYDAERKTPIKEELLKYMTKEQYESCLKVTKYELITFRSKVDVPIPSNKEAA
jgi:hypothetical protein